jgi:hypothetical protein
MRAHKMNKRASKRVFRKTADSAHSKNFGHPAPMRGGYRL